MKKSILIVFILGLAATMLIGCGKSELVTAVEQKIAMIQGSAVECEDVIVDAYSLYSKMPEEKQKQVNNREVLIKAYAEIDKLMAKREADAKEVERYIDSINRDNIYVFAETTKIAYRAYNSLDDKTRRCVNSEKAILVETDFIKASQLDEKISADNIFDLLSFDFKVGDKQNYGKGSFVTQDGYKIDLDSGDIIPVYDIEGHNDYATPVYVVVTPKYPNLTLDVSFHINLHQTYTGLNLLKKGQQEYEYQEGDISYSSSQGRQVYCVLVEINKSKDSVFDQFGVAFDINDYFHDMNEFDVSKVGYSSISGRVRFGSNF